MVTMDQAKKPKMVSMKATKPMSELLKEAWKAKARNKAQAMKSLKAAKKMSSLAPPTMEILSFEDWQTKSPKAPKTEVVRSPTSTLANIECITNEGKLLQVE